MATTRVTSVGGTLRLQSRMMSADERSSIDEELAGRGGLKPADGDGLNRGGSWDTLVEIDVTGLAGKDGECVNWGGSGDGLVRKDGAVFDME